MAATPEGKVKKWVKDQLKLWEANTGLSLYTNWPVPGGYGESMLDLVGCVCGMFFMIETKVIGKVMSDRQKQIAARVKAAGGKVFVIDHVGDTRMVNIMMFFDTARKQAGL